MNKQIKRDQLFAKWQLRERGWTPSMITKLMPEHDNERNNPHYNCAGAMKFYKKRRVYGYERGELWKQLQLKSLVRIEAGKKAWMKASLTIEKKLQLNQENRIQELNNINFNTPDQLTPHQLQKLAIDHYNQYIKEPSFPNATLSCEQAFLDRITVNYVRHDLTLYDDHLAHYTHRDTPISRETSYKLIKLNCLNQIAQTFPHLKEECESQSELSLGEDLESTSLVSQPKVIS